MPNGAKAFFSNSTYYYFLNETYSWNREGSVKIFEFLFFINSTRESAIVILYIIHKKRSSFVHIVVRWKPAKAHAQLAEWRLLAQNDGCSFPVSIRNLTNNSVNYNKIWASGAFGPVFVYPDHNFQASLCCRFRYPSPTNRHTYNDICVIIIDI